MASRNTAEPLLGRLADARGGQAPSSGAYEKIRRRYEEFMHVTFDELGLASREQTKELREWLESIDPTDEKAILEAERFSEEIDRMEEKALSLHKTFLQELHDARKDEVISQQSFDEWVAWMRDPNRPYKEKETSVLREQPDGLREYLKERRELTVDRKKLLENKRLDDVASPRLKKEIEFLRSDKEWFETLTFSQRRNLIDRIRAGLAVEKGGEEYAKLFTQAERILKDATKEPQPALHRDKVGTWLRRIFESGATPEQIKAFITGQGPQEGHSLPQLIGIWRAVAIQFWVLRKDPAFEGVKPAFINTKAFLFKHYDDRVAYVSLMRTQRDRAKVLRSQARSRIDIPEQNKDAWLSEHLFNGTHTLEDLESIINGDLAKHLEPIKDYMEGKGGGGGLGGLGDDGGEKKRRSEAQQLDELIGSIDSSALQRMCLLFCSMGSKHIGAAGWTSYNREWCNKHGYLNPEREHAAIRDGKMQALTKRRRFQRRGVVSEAIEGKTGEEEYVQLSRTAPTNVCIDLTDAGAVNAYIESIRHYADDVRALYWTNAIFHIGGSLMPRDRQNTVTKKMYTMRNLLRKMEKGGRRYGRRGAETEYAMKLFLFSSILLVACTRTGGPDALKGNPLVEETVADAMIDYVTNLQIRADERGEPITNPAVLRAIDETFVRARVMEREANERQDAGKRGDFYGVNDNGYAAGGALILGAALYIGYDFEVPAAPGMRVLLAQHVAPRTKEDLFGEPTRDLGPLRSIFGAQAYAVGELTEDEWNRYRTVAIYSEPLKMVIALAQIREAVRRTQE